MEFDLSSSLLPMNPLGRHSSIPDDEKEKLTHESTGGHSDTVSIVNSYKGMNQLAVFDGQRITHKHPSQSL